MPYKAKVTDKQSWDDIPTCKESGVPTAYVMLRGIFMAPGVTKEQTAFYVDLLKKVRETPEWKDYMEKGAFNQTSMSGEEFTHLAREGREHAPRADEGSRLPGQEVRRRPERDPSVDGEPARRRSGVLATNSTSCDGVYVVGGASSC